MPNVVMGPRELMAAADRLTGVHPGMAHAEIRAVQDAATLERQWVRYLLDEYKQTADSARRAELVAAMALRARESAPLKALIRRELAGRVSSTSLQDAGGRPRTHVSDVVRKREWARAARARRRQAP